MLNLFVSGGLVPVLLAFGLIGCLIKPQQGWRIARFALNGTLLALGVTCAVALASSYGAAATPDVLGLLMSALIAVLGWSIVRFSHQYLAGEANQAGFVQALMVTLLAVSVLVLTDNLLVMILAWSVTSLSLHRLLLFYPQRRAAQIVAHKRFLVCRLAELCLLVALGLIYWTAETFSISELSAWVAAQNSLPFALQLAMALMAPVLTSITMAQPWSASWVSQARMRAFSAAS